MIDGGAGNNMVVYTGLHTNYGFKLLAHRSLEVTDLRSGKPDGVDQDKNIDPLSLPTGCLL
jgi:serralysin